MFGFKQFFIFKTGFGIKKNKNIAMQLNILVLQKQKYSVNL